MAVVGYGLASRIGPKAGAAWLALCSIAFYAFWNLLFVTLLIGSVIFNFAIGTSILKFSERKKAQDVLLTVGISGNILILFYFKYFASIFNFLSHTGIIQYGGDISIMLPLGISFFTFTQIGYLVDCRQGLGKSLELIHYAVFATFFPHLIAGPILHIREIAPQILNDATYRLRASNLAIGLSYFVLGLSKKVLLADPLASLATVGFAAPSHLQFTSTWILVLDYSAQLYFDFSGYSDMAIGLAYMFGIRFPLNFNSPYKARSIIEFWQRWHMTLTRYLTLLLFNPIALWATRRRMARGKPVRAKQLSLGAFSSTIVLPTTYTMLLAGVWHGAGPQFIVFGLLHAVYLTVNHAWRVYGLKPPNLPRRFPLRFLIGVGQVALTFACVLVAQIFFRANSVGGALSVLSGMAGLHGFDPAYVPARFAAMLGGLGAALAHWGWITQAMPESWPPKNPLGILLRFVIIFALPNTQQIMAKFAPYLAKVEAPRWKLLLWEPQVQWAAALGVLLFLDLMSLNYSPPFLYFQF
ncbi:MAG: MBOAT family O-acyltransferase [Methylocella sp.]